MNEHDKPAHGAALAAGVSSVMLYTAEVMKKHHTCGACLTRSLIVSLCATLIANEDMDEEEFVDTMSDLVGFAWFQHDKATDLSMRH